MAQQRRKSKPSKESHAEHRAVITNVHDAIKAACAAFDANRKKDIPPILEPWQSTINGCDERVQSIYCRLLAFGLASTGKLVEAEAVCLKGLDGGMQPSFDLHFVLSFTYASLKEFTRAKEHAERFLAEHASAQQANFFSPLTSSAGYVSQTHNCLGGALMELREFARAEDEFEKAIKGDAGNHLAYLNLTTLHIRANKRDKALQAIARGMRACPQSTELKLLQNSLRHRASVSACMIVKNEEDMLPGCLESIRDWVDEIIIVDTGSTDRTVAIAESFNAKVFQQPWEGDFSKHRNYSMSLATCDWIFVIDADERFCGDDVPVLQQLVSNQEHEILSVSVYNVHKSKEVTSTFLPSIRLFRRSLGLTYKGIVHNSLQVPETAVVRRAHLRLFHYGYDLSPEKMEKKFHRTKALLESQLASEPNNAFAHFNYAQVLRGDAEGVREEFAEIVIASARRAVELTSPNKPEERSIHLMALNQLAWTYLYAHQYGEAMTYCEQALQHKPDYLDPVMVKAHILSRMERYEDAKKQYQAYLDIQASYDPAAELENIILHHPDSRYIAWYSLAMIAHIEGDQVRAKLCLQKVRSQQANYLNTNSRLGAILMAENDLDGAESCFRQQLEHEPESLSALLGLAYAFLLRKDFTRAKMSYSNVLAIHPSNITARLKLGFIDVLHNNVAAASQHLTRASQLGCDHSEIRQTINDAIGYTQDYGRAASLYQQLIDGGVVSAVIYNELGGCCFRMERFSDAERWFALACDQPFSESLSVHNLGLSQIRQNKISNAIESFERFLAIEPHMIETHLILGDLYKRSHDFEKAIASFERYLSVDPRNALVLFNLAECYFELEHFQSALLGYHRVVELDPGADQAKARIATLTAAESAANISTPSR